MSDQTKKCPKCSEDVQKSAKKCKHCGANLGNWFERHKIVIGILTLIIIGFIIGSLSDIDTTTTSSENYSNSKSQQNIEAIEVTAVDLSKAYDDNKVAADAKYEGKMVKITGIIDDIGKDIMDDPYVSLKGIETSLFGVQCMFPDDRESSLINLSNGQSITVIGELSGEMIGNVIVRDCSIVE